MLKTWDQELVDRFLSEYSKLTGVKYSQVEWMDQKGGSEQKVEAIAHDESGKTLAIEHTLIQPFVGEREDSQRFLTAIAPLEKDPSLRLPNYLVMLSIPVRAIPKGVDWRTVCHKVGDWLRKNLAPLPQGPSKHTIPNLSFSLEIFINKQPYPGLAGEVYVARGVPPESLQDVVREALRRKVAKLARAQASKRILLLEQADILHFYRKIAEAVEALRLEFPQLEKIDEIWVAGTVAWERERTIAFHRIFPNGDQRIDSWYKEPSSEAPASGDDPKLCR